MGEEFTPRATWPSALWLTESDITLGAISINFSNSPTCQHLTVSVPSHSTSPKEPLSCMGQQTLLHTPCCGCYHHCWDHFLSQVWAHAPVLEQHHLQVSLDMDPTSHCSFPNPGKGRAQLIYVWESSCLTCVLSAAPWCLLFSFPSSCFPIPKSLDVVHRFCSSASHSWNILRTSLFTVSCQHSIPWSP